MEDEEIALISVDWRTSRSLLAGADTGSGPNQSDNTFEILNSFLVNQASPFHGCLEQITGSSLLTISPNRLLPCQSLFKIPIRSGRPRTHTHTHTKPHTRPNAQTRTHKCMRAHTQTRAEHACVHTLTDLLLTFPPPWSARPFTFRSAAFGDTCTCFPLAKVLHLKLL